MGQWFHHIIDGLGWIVSDPTLLSDGPANALKLDLKVLLKRD